MVVEVKNILLSLLRAHIEGVIVNGSPDLRCVEPVHTGIIDALDAPHQINDDRLPLVTLIEAINRLAVPLRKRVVFCK